MTIRTITKRFTTGASRRRIPGWLWFVGLWCGGVGGAMLLGFAFKLLMNATLFAVVR